MPITNAKMNAHPFLQSMYADPYFPKVCVDKVKRVLLALCERIEQVQPADLDRLYVLTHAATDVINDLAECFDKHDSEIESCARDAIAEDFGHIAAAYGFDADIEELIATRDW